MNGPFFETLFENTHFLLRYSAQKPKFKIVIFICEEGKLKSKNIDGWLRMGMLPPPP